MGANQLKKDAHILISLDELLKDATAGDPIKGTKWTRKTLRQLRGELKRQGFKVAPETLRRLLLASGYVLRVNRKCLTKKHAPHRDRQMRYILGQRRAFLKAGKPVISVDTKKKELIGNFKNPGRTWRREVLAVLELDFPIDGAKRSPMGSTI